MPNGKSTKERLRRLADNADYISKQLKELIKEAEMKCWYCGEPIKGEPWRFPENDGVYCTLCALILCVHFADLPTKPVVPKEVEM